MKLKLSDHNNKNNLILLSVVDTRKVSFNFNLVAHCFVFAFACCEQEKPEEGGGPSVRELI